MGKTATHAEAAVMLREAREHIEKDGWAKGSFKTTKGAVCLLQALRDVNGAKHGEDVKRECFRVLLTHMGHSISTTGDGIPSWNDAGSRTKDDVLTMLLAGEHIERELAQGD